MTTVAPRRAIDSPVFWALLFGGAALLSIYVVAPKYAVRQARVERMAEARRQAWLRGGAHVQIPKDVPQTELDNSSYDPAGRQLQRPLGPLVIFIAGALFLLALAWSMFGGSCCSSRASSTAISTPTPAPAETLKAGAP